MKEPLVLKARITAEHLSPQNYDHLKYVLEKELNRNGVIVDIYDKWEATED